MNDPLTWKEISKLYGVMDKAGGFCHQAASMYTDHQYDDGFMSSIFWEDMILSAWEVLAPEEQERNIR